MQTTFRLPRLGDISANKEMLLLWLRPNAGPRQSHHAPVGVNVAAFKMTRQVSAPRLPHFLARALKILTVKELLRAMADHFIGAVAEDRLTAGADPNERPAPVDNQN